MIKKIGMNTWSKEELNVPKFIDLTDERGPNLLWIPEHSVQIITPNPTSIHAGSRKNLLWEKKKKKIGKNFGLNLVLSNLHKVDFLLHLKFFEKFRP